MASIRRARSLRLSLRKQTFKGNPPAADPVLIPKTEQQLRHPSEQNMANAKHERNDALNSLAHPMMQSMMQTPMFAIWAEMNGAFLESIANAQKDWSDFVH